MHIDSSKELNVELVCSNSNVQIFISLNQNLPAKTLRNQQFCSATLGLFSIHLDGNHEATITIEMNDE